MSIDFIMTCENPRLSKCQRCMSMPFTFAGLYKQQLCTTQSGDDDGGDGGNDSITDTAVDVENAGIVLG